MGWGGGGTERVASTPAEASKARETVVFSDTQHDQVQVREP
jgi:hypothetical protein